MLMLAFSVCCLSQIFVSLLSQIYVQDVMLVMEREGNH